MQANPRNQHWNQNSIFFCFCTLPLLTGHSQISSQSQAHTMLIYIGYYPILWAGGHLKKWEDWAAPSPALGTSPRRLSRSRVRSLGAIGHRAPSSATMLARGKLRGQGWHITRVAPPFWQSLGSAQFPFQNTPFLPFLCQVEKAQGQGWHDLSPRAWTLLLKIFLTFSVCHCRTYLLPFPSTAIAISGGCSPWQAARTGSCEVRGGATWVTSLAGKRHPQATTLPGELACLTPQIFHPVSPTPTLQPISETQHGIKEPTYNWKLHLSLLFPVSWDRGLQQKVCRCKDSEFSRMKQKNKRDGKKTRIINPQIICSSSKYKSNLFN